MFARLAQQTVGCTAALALTAGARRALRACRPTLSGCMLCSLFVLGARSPDAWNADSAKSNQIRPRSS